jgi:hypothetical protein
MSSQVGGGLPPMAECQSVHLLLIRHYREQAPSHIWPAFIQLNTALYANSAGAPPVCRKMIGPSSNR